jgi:hypothetical protein
MHDRILVVACVRLQAHGPAAAHVLGLLTALVSSPCAYAAKPTCGSPCLCVHLQVVGSRRAPTQSRSQQQTAATPAQPLPALCRPRHAPLRFHPAAQHSAQPPHLCRPQQQVQKHNQIVAAALAAPSNSCYSVHWCATCLHVHAGTHMAQVHRGGGAGCSATRCLHACSLHGTSVILLHYVILHYITCITLHHITIHFITFSTQQGVGTPFRSQWRLTRHTMR